MAENSARCRFYFDSLSRVLEDSQSHDTGGSRLTRNATNHAFTSLPATGFTFPQGRQIWNTYDLLYRRTQVANVGGAGSAGAGESSSSSSADDLIAAWEFFGPGRVAETNLGNGLTCTFMNNARTNSAVQSAVALPAWGASGGDRLGYDGAGRMIAKRFIPSGLDGASAYVDTTPVVAFTTRFDKASNKLFERHLHAENRSHLYQPTSGIAAGGGLDSLNRLLQYQRGTLASGGGSVTTPITLPGTDSFRGYELDHLGNWKRTTYTATPPAHASSSSSSLTSSSSSSSSSSAFHLEDTEVRQHNALNQITRITDGGSTTPFVYDASGDFTDDGTRLMTYDATRGATPAPRRDGHGFAMGETVTRILRDQTWSSHESDRATRRLRVPCYALFGSLGRNMVSVLPVPATLPAGNHPLCTGRGSACCCCINGTT